MKRDIISKKDTYTDELKYWKNIYEDSNKIDSLKKIDQLEHILTQKRAWQKTWQRSKKPACGRPNA